MKYVKGIVKTVRFNSCRTSNVWLPSLSRLRPFRTCFSVTCPRLDENDGIVLLQACAYKVGEIKIKELRRKAEQKLGKLFI